MKIYIFLLSFITSLIILNGCTSPSTIMPMENGVYTISKSAPTGFTPVDTIRRAAYKDINELAESKGKSAQILTINEVPAGFARWPQVEIRFKLVDSQNLAHDTVFQKIKTSTVYDSTGKPIDSQIEISKDTKDEMYNKLKKLGELRDSGVLTDIEFQKEKEKILK